MVLLWYKHPGVSTDWTEWTNTTALNKKGQIRAHYLRTLKSLLEMLCQFIVANDILYTVVYWGAKQSSGDANHQNKLTRKAITGQAWNSLEAAAENRMENLITSCTVLPIRSMGCSHGAPLATGSFHHGVQRSPTGEIICHLPSSTTMPPPDMPAHPPSPDMCLDSF